MSEIVRLRDVIEALDMIGDSMAVYLNRKTGKIVTVTEDDRFELDREANADDEDEDREMPEWQRESVAEAREALESDDYLPLPNRFEIDEYRIMERFCLAIEDEAIREEALRAIRGRGAFRYFKDTMHRHNLIDQWYRHREAAYERIAVDWLDAHEIPYARDPDGPV